MTRQRPLARSAVGCAVAIAALAFLHYKPWQRDRALGSAGNGRLELLKVGFLPVT